MIIELNREEIIQACKDYLKNKYSGNYKIEMAGYAIFEEVKFELKNIKDE
jgi:hypothetical protein